MVTNVLMQHFGPIFKDGYVQGSFWAFQLLKEMRALRCLEKSGKNWDRPSYVANILEERIPQLHCCESIRQAMCV